MKVRDRVTRIRVADTHAAAATSSGQVGEQACAIARGAVIIAAAMLMSGCAVAMLGGAARSGGTSAAPAPATSGGASSSTASSGRASSGATSAGSASNAGKPASQAPSDSSITAAVRSRLGASSTLRALKIGVDTHDGIVTLKGQVNTLADKSAAQAEARAVNGVKAVNNQLTVR